ncbi:MAG: HNH endonuclease, partial [Tepidiformaceae bacterium]
MSTHRRSPGRGYIEPASLPTGANGRALCRQCGDELSEGRRRTFCSDACVHEWRLRSDSHYLKEQVRRRDRGVCALCGVDTYRLARVVKAWRATLLPEGRQGLDALLKAWKWRKGGRQWDADHILPVVSGGGECDIDNLRTLCIWCHRRETASLAQA